MIKYIIAFTCLGQGRLSLAENETRSPWPKFTEGARDGRRRSFPTRLGLKPSLGRRSAVVIGHPASVALAPPKQPPLAPVARSQTGLTLLLRGPHLDWF
jgi:hypothetical protein